LCFPPGPRGIPAQENGSQAPGLTIEVRRLLYIPVSGPPTDAVSVLVITSMEGCLPTGQPGVHNPQLWAPEYPSSLRVA
jgi:hypothetical protein